jgi:hypothetical protein
MKTASKSTPDLMRFGYNSSPNKKLKKEDGVAVSPDSRPRALKPRSGATVRPVDVAGDHEKPRRRSFWSSAFKRLRHTCLFRSR